MRMLRTITTVAVLGVTLGGGAAFAAAQGGTVTTSPVAAATGPAGTASPESLPASAAQASPHLGVGWVLRLPDSDRACVDKAGIRRPVGPLSEAERASIRGEIAKAATACGIKVPDGSRAAKAKAFREGLTEAQTACLRMQDVTRPIGPLSDAERTQLRTDRKAAAKECGVTRTKASTS